MFGSLIKRPPRLLLHTGCGIVISQEDTIRTKPPWFPFFTQVSMMKPTEYTSTTDPTHRNVGVITSLNVHESRRRRRRGGRSEADRRRLLLHQRRTIRKPIMFIIYARLATSMTRCTVSDATPFMSRPLWRRGDKLAGKIERKMFVCTARPACDVLLQ